MNAVVMLHSKECYKYESAILIQLHIWTINILWNSAWLQQSCGSLLNEESKEYQMTAATVVRSIKCCKDTSAILIQIHISSNKYSWESSTTAAVHYGLNKMWKKHIHEMCVQHSNYDRNRHNKNTFLDCAEPQYSIHILQTGEGIYIHGENPHI